MTHGAASLLGAAYAFNIPPIVPIVFINCLDNERFLAVETTPSPLAVTHA